MTKIKVWLIWLSIALNVFFAGTYMAERWLPLDRLLPWSSGSGRNSLQAMPYHALDLTSEQRAVFEAQRDRFHGFLMESRQAIRSRQAELIHLLSAQKPERAAIASKQQEILDLQGKLQQMVISHLLEVSAPLNQKQRAAFFALLKERMAQQMPGYPPACY